MRKNEQLSSIIQAVLLFTVQCLLAATFPCDLPPTPHHHCPPHHLPQISLIPVFLPQEPTHAPLH
ncbi:hypothetical protein E2C01_075531 [Portunus trituberculatus]|uniref:Uncharacterized protein n=1 Tax=Portunus trituberculatus TaxID=210409 RepID=A0A5B7IF74_PORTR|nr:hypothetical protein [Portunus trituberculatus]